MKNYLFVILLCFLAGCEYNDSWDPYYPIPNHANVNNQLSYNRVINNSKDTSNQTNPNNPNNQNNQIVDNRDHSIHNANNDFNSISDGIQNDNGSVSYRGESSYHQVHTLLFDYFNEGENGSTIRRTFCDIWEGGHYLGYFLVKDSLLVNKLDTTVLSSSLTFHYIDGYQGNYSQKYVDWLFEVCDGLRAAIYDRQTNDGLLTLKYFNGKTEIKTVQYDFDESIIIEDLGFEYIGGHVAWNGYFSGKYHTFYPGDTVVPNQNFTLSYLPIKGIYPDELESFFQKAKESDDNSGLHNLLIKNVRSSDIPLIEEQINQNNDFWLNLTISGLFLEIPWGTFSNLNKSIYKLYLENVTSIGYEGFYYLSNLSEVYFDSSIRTISDRAFYYCGRLSEIHLEGKPPQLKGKNCFKNASSMLTVYVKSNYYDDYLKAEYWKDMKIVKR